MYTMSFKYLVVIFTFTHFEEDVLKSLYVAHSQLQPNNWAFIRGFRILCEGLGFEPSLGIFFCFYGTKGAEKCS